MRRLRAVVPPFGVEEDVKWIEEEVPDEERNDGAVADPSSSSQSNPDQEVLVPGVRRCLPPAPPPASKPSMFAIVKKIASTPGGAQLMDIQLPLQLCEPMSELQRRAEILVPGVRCLDAAARAPPLSLDRLLHVAAFAASTYACTVRTTKCVSPILGETVDVVIPDLGVDMMSEFVACDRKGGFMSSAFAMRGRGWRVRGDDVPHASLRAAGLEIHAAFRTRLVFDDGDVYDWARATPLAAGLASGKNAIAYDGRVRIAPVLASCPSVDFTRGDPDGADDGLDASSRRPPPSHVLHAVLDFKGPTLMAAIKGGSAVSRRYSGWVERVPARETRETTPRSRERVPGVELEGDFGTHLDAVVGKGVRKRLWTTPEAVPGCRYGYTRFSAGLNDDSVCSSAPPTDSRRRKDTRLLESGEYEKAQSHLDRYLASERLRSAAALEEAIGGDGKMKAVWFEELGGGVRRRAAAAATEGAAPLASSAAVSAFVVADAEPNGDNEYRRAPLRWRSKGDYWRAREAGDWSSSPRIFE